MRIVELLPAPFGPRNPNASPGRISKSMPSTATNEPKRFVSARASMSGTVTAADASQQRTGSPPIARGPVRVKRVGPATLISVVQRMQSSTSRWTSRSVANRNGGSPGRGSSRSSSNREHAARQRDAPGHHCMEHAMQGRRVVIDDPVPDLAITAHRRPRSTTPPFQVSDSGGPKLERPAELGSTKGREMQDRKLPGGDSRRRVRRADPFGDTRSGCHSLPPQHHEGRAVSEFTARHSTATAKCRPRWSSRNSNAGARTPSRIPARVAELSVRVAQLAALAREARSARSTGAHSCTTSASSMCPRADLRDARAARADRSQGREPAHRIGSRWLATTPGLSSLVPYRAGITSASTAPVIRTARGGHEVPLTVALVAVCDCWDAISEPRPYRVTYSFEDAATRDAERVRAGNGAGCSSTGCSRPSNRHTSATTGPKPVEHPRYSAANSTSCGTSRGQRSNKPPVPARAASLRSIHSRSPHGGSTSRDPGTRVCRVSDVARVWYGSLAPLRKMSVGNARAAHAASGSPGTVAFGSGQYTSIQRSRVSMNSADPGRGTAAGWPGSARALPPNPAAPRPPPCRPATRRESTRRNTPSPASAARRVPPISTRSRASTRRRDAAPPRATKPVNRRSRR